MRKTKAFLVALLAASLYAAATVGPASGASAPLAASGWDCDPLVMQAPTGRGGSAREPVLDEVHADLPAAAKGKAGPKFRVTVPVWFHVVTDGSIGDLTATQIADQIAVLNLTFAGREGGARSGFSFELAGVTRTDNARWFYSSTGGAEREMKKTLHRGGPETLNFYSTTAGPYLGWAYLPSIVDSRSQAYLDGVVVDWESLPGTSDRYEGRFDQGKTGTHEVGHWLNLEHTFYNGCTTRGDFVDDTPPEKTPSFGCPEGKDTCAAPGLDPIHNYMDYSDDPCYTEFTPGQAQRMKDAWLFYRA